MKRRRAEEERAAAAARRASRSPGSPEAGRPSSIGAATGAGQGADAVATAHRRKRAQRHQPKRGTERAGKGQRR